MKKLNHLFYASLSLILVLSSCSKKSNDVFRMIPETALAVISVHPGQLMEKGKLLENDFLKNKASENELSRKIFEDPSSSGIDLEKYSSLFILPHEGEFACMVMPLNSREKFETMLEEIENETGEKFEEGKLEGYSTRKQDNVLILYNKSFVLLISELDGWPDPDLNEVATYILTTDKEHGLLTDKDFNNFLGKQKDINAWISTNNLGEMNGMKDMGSGLDIMGGIKNNYGHAFADFQNGFMTLTTNLRFNAGWKETIEKYNFLDEKAIKDVLEYIPSEDLIFVGNTNMDPSRVMDLLKFINRDLDNSLNEMSERFGLESEEIMNIFSGEAAFSFNAKKSPAASSGHFSMEGLPTAVYAVRIKNEDNFNNLIKTAGQEAGMIEKDGYYSISHGVPVFMARVKKDMIISNNEEIILEIVKNGKIKNNVTSAPYSDILTTNPVCFFLNLDRNNYSEEMRSMLEEKMGTGMPEMVDKFGQNLKSLTFSANIEEWEFRVDMTDDSENILYMLLQHLN